MLYNEIKELLDEYEAEGIIEKIYYFKEANTFAFRVVKTRKIAYGNYLRYSREELIKQLIGLES